MIVSSARPERVLLVTTTIDLAADRVVEQLLARGASPVRINTDRLPYQSEVLFSQQPFRLQFMEAGRKATFENIVSFWYRRVRMPSPPPEVSPETNEYAFREAMAGLRGALEILASSTARSFGSPSTLDRAESKVLQLHLAVGLGFQVPRTLIASRPDELREFCVGPIIGKPLHSGYLHLGGRALGIFTRRLSPADLVNLDTALPCPMIFQDEVPKAFDIRVTVVRNRVFAAAIDSQSDPDAQVDWRRTTRPDLPHFPHDLPDDVQASCIAMADALGTGFAAIDLVLKPQGDYVFLEANPNGEWLWIEDRLGFPISNCIASYLSEGFV